MNDEEEGPREELKGVTRPVEVPDGGGPEAHREVEPQSPEWAPRR